MISEQIHDDLKGLAPRYADQWNGNRSTDPEWLTDGTLLFRVEACDERRAERLAEDYPRSGEVSGRDILNLIEAETSDDDHKLFYLGHLLYGEDANSRVAAFTDGRLILYVRVDKLRILDLVTGPFHEVTANVRKRESEPILTFRDDGSRVVALLAPLRSFTQPGEVVEHFAGELDRIRDKLPGPLLAVRAGGDSMRYYPDSTLSVTDVRRCLGWHTGGLKVRAEGQELVIFDPETGEEEGRIFLVPKP